MIPKHRIEQLPNAIFSELGWDYFVSDGANDYLTTDLVRVREQESDALYKTANRMYELYIQAGEYVIRHDKLSDLGIPKNLHELIRHTWEDDRNLHLFGRFDFAGGIDGLPIKLLEFNADTPTSLPETAIIQWAQLKANGLSEDGQFNFVFDALRDNFERLKELNPDKAPAILFSTMRGAPEDDNNVSLLQEAAREAGFETAFCYVDEVVFSDVNGIFAHNSANEAVNYPFWFKLIPWEYIAEDEPLLCDQLTRIVKRDLAIVLNPAYTMIFQSKGILKYLWDLYSGDSALLETSFKEPIGRSGYAFVQKVLFGREGSNVTVYDTIGLPEEIKGGDYAGQRTVFQERADLARDDEGQYYQAGVFFAFEACGLGFRRAKSLIIDDGAQFVGHMVE